MLLKSIRRMHGLCFEGRCRWTHHFLFVTWLLLITSTPPKALGYFLGDTKAVLNGCEDHWTLQDKATMPLLFEMTLCVDIRVVVPGAWVAFSYSSVHAPRPELGLEGDDEALYGWLLRVRHRFPFRLSPTYWHRLCLRRDVRHNSFSLEVDGKMVAERTVIAQAIPPTGSLWLGCRPRDRPPGAMLGKVELYLFRMWADLDNHGLCEDGTVIGWNAQYWGVTSRRARQIDPNLLCDHRRLRRGAPAKSGVTNAMSTGFGRSFSRPPEMPLTTTTSSPVIATTGIHMHTQSSTVTGSPLVNCDISQLCSDKNAYFWMPIRVEAKDGTKTEGDVKSLVSNAFGCHSDGGDATRGVTGFTDFCQGDRQPQVVQVNCRVKSNISETTCDVLLQLSHAVSACALQRTGDSALQQAGEQIQATIIGEVERVGRDVCRDVEPSSGRFVRCTSSSSLEDICQSNNNSTLTCSLIEPNSDPAPQPMTESCSSEAPRFCDCMAFCNSARQFFALRININSASVNIHFLKGLLSGFRAAHICDTILGSACQDILRRYQRFHLECHGTKQRLYSCMVILEMSGPVNACFLNKLLQKVIDSNSGITNERPLTRMVVCGPPGLTVRTLLASNLTWVASDLLISDVCQPDPTLLKCEANERLAVLLTDSCPPEPSTTGQSTAQPSSLTKTTTTEALTRSVANALLQTNTTAEITATVEQRNASQETAQLITTTPLTTINSTQSSTPVLHTSSQNITVTVSDSAPVQNTTLSNNTTLLRHTENTKVQNKTTAHQKTTVFTRSYSVNSTLQITTTAPTDSTLNKTTLSRLHTTVYNVTTVDTVKPSANHTTEYNLTTVHRVTPSANHITEYNVTVDTLTPSVNLTTAYNVTTGIPSYNQTTEYNVTVNTVTPSTTHTTEYNTTTVETVTLSANLTTEYNITAVDTVTPSTTHTVGYNITKLETVTPSDNLTKAYNVTSGTPSYNHATDFNTISISTVTPSTNQITEYNVTVDTVTHSANHTIEYNVTTVDTVTPSTNHTVEYNVTVEAVTPSANLTSAYNITTADTVTPSTNHTTAYNETSVTPSNNHTTVYNVTKAGSDRKNDNSTFTTTNTTVSTITTSPNHTKVNNVTTATNNHTTGNSTVPNNYRTADTTVPNNYTTVNTIGPYNYTTVNTTVPNNYTTGNSTVPNNYRTVDTTVRNNYTTVNTTVATNHTTVNNTVPNNYTTVNTTVPNNYTTVNTTVANNRTTVNTTVPNNHTTVNTTVSNNYTTVNNVSTVPNNYTTVNKVTTVSNNNKTVENITTPTESQNETATDNVTTAPIKESQQNTTAPSKNMTASTTVIQVTPNNTTTSTRNSTVVNVTFVVENTTKHTMAPLKNHTGNPTTARLTHNISTTKNNNITKAATVVSTTIDLTHTAGLTSNLSSTARSLTTDFNLTTKRPNNLRTPAASIEGTTSTTATTTIHGSLPATTFAKVSLTSSTTTTSLTTTTKPDSATPSTTFTETTTSQEALEEQANELLNQTQDMSQLNSSQVAELVGELEKLLDGPSVSQALGKKLFNVISNLMEGDSQILSASANRLVQLVDDLGLKLVVTGDREILSSGSLVLAVRNVDGTNFPTTSVDILNTDNVQLRALRRSRFKRSGSPLGSVFLPSSLTTGLSPEQQKQASRVQFTFYTKSVFFQDVALDNETRVGPVLAASVANLSISNLSENIHFTIRNIKPKHANASCAFWDFTQNGGRGGWSSAGCFVVNATAEETICSCNHLTSFAILLDLSREENIDPRHAQILTFITYIGCGISAIFLAVTLLTYLSFEKLLRDIPAKILVQLCLSLLLLNLVFLVDGWLALYPAVGLCISTAFFLHYFMLTSFTWAGLEALHMYLSIVRVFTPYLSRYMLKFSLIGWGVPLLVVIIVISVDKDNYGLVTYGRNTDGTSDDFCWLRNDIAFYVGVVAYFLLIFSLCLLVFIVVMVQLSRIKKQNPQNQPPNRGVITDLRSIAGLVILLGLTWGFALFAWGPLYLPFVYLFSIFNSLQGFFVFVFHCAVKENVRRQWRTYLCCGKLRLAENSEWSRTATQNNRNMSVATATTSATASAPHFTSRSSSVISDATNSSGSVFMDSGISDGTNSDTVLNDIHRRNLSL